MNANEITNVSQNASSKRKKDWKRAPHILCKNLKDTNQLKTRAYVLRMQE